MMQTKLYLTSTLQKTYCVKAIVSDFVIMKLGYLAHL